MQIAVEISMYPLSHDYEDPILDFIRGLHKHPGIQIATNDLSTQLTGEYDAVMQALTAELKESFQEETKASFVLKILNVGIAPGRKVEV